MRMRSAIVAAVLAVCSGISAQALDRDAKVIGQAGIDFVSYKDMNAARLVVWDEAALDFEREWAVVAGLGAGKFFRSGMDDSQTTLFAALGAKWYPAQTASIQLLGTVEWQGSGGGFRVIGGTATFEQRFIIEQAALSPFLNVSASLQNSKVNPWGTDEDPFTCLVLKAGAGCDMIMSEDVTLMFYVAVEDSQGPAGNENRNYADGWSGTIALKYHWY